MIRQIIRSFARVAGVAGVWLLPAGAFADQITVFAAASLRTALDQINGEFSDATGHTVRVSYAGSSALARQITLGAPADVFISANAAWMDFLEREALIQPGTRFDLITNRLVVIAPAADASPLDLSAPGSVAARLQGSPLAMALVQAVPAGIYGKEALLALGHWPEVAGQVAQTDNVRAALALVSAGEAPLGVVYASDALVEPGVAVVAEIPADTHARIVYPAAAIAAPKAEAASEFLRFLRTQRALAIMTGAGFQPAGD